jgi:hypothetical protein
MSDITSAQLVRQIEDILIQFSSLFIRMLRQQPKGQS